MALTYGFYNSLNGDRRYNAIQMSSIFDGIIRDGILMHVGDRFEVKAAGGLGITVGTGRSWFDHTWTYNESVMALTVMSADNLLDRIDALVLEVDARDESRINSIRWVYGTPATIPQRPALIHERYVNQYPLAYISVPRGTTNILQANITNMIGTSETPFVTAPLEKIDASALLAQWNSQWNIMYTQQNTDWRNQFNRQETDFLAQMNKQKIDWTYQFNRQETDFLAQMLEQKQNMTQQNTDWLNQLNRQETDFLAQMDILNAQYHELLFMYHALETEAFTLINNNFDDWSVRRGCKKTTEFLPVGDIVEKIIVISVGFLLAQKITVFNAATANDKGSILETIVFYPWEINETVIGPNGLIERTIFTTSFNVSKLTTFNLDGSITEIISGEPVPQRLLDSNRSPLNDSDGNTLGVWG